MRSKSFTLVELIVVIAIIAVLASVVMPSAFRAIEKSKIARAISDIRSIKNAAEMFHADVGLYPGSQWGDMSSWGDHFSPAPYGEGFVKPPIAHDGDSFASSHIADWNGPYLEKWSMTPWAMPYMWDYNNWDSQPNGISYEHIVWLDLADSSVGVYNQNQKVPSASRDHIKLMLDGNLDYTNGTVALMNSGFYGTSVEVIVSEGDPD